MRNGLQGRGRAGAHPAHHLSDCKGWVRDKQYCMWMIPLREDLMSGADVVRSSLGTEGGRWQYKTGVKPHRISAGLRKSRTEFSSAESSVSHFTFCLATFTRGFALTSL